MTGLWYAGARISFDRRGPAYLVHADAATRVSMRRRAMRSDTAFAAELFESAEFARLSREQRDAVVVKLLRVNVVSWVVNRPEPGAWGEADRRELRRCVRRCLEIAPGAAGPLSRADRALVDAILDEGSDIDDVIRLGRERGRFLRPAGLLPRRASDVFRREAPLRFGAASALAGGIRR